MQKTCLNCTHVGVCSKRMQFIVNNYLVKRHYDEIENVSKTLDISVNCDSYAEKDFFSFICARVRDYSDGEVWSDGDQILCKTESAANALCDLLWQLYNERGEAFDLHTGYYDPKEDEKITKKTDTPAGGMCLPTERRNIENPQYPLGYRWRQGGSCLPAEGSRAAE